MIKLEMTFCSKWWFPRRLVQWVVEKALRQIDIKAIHDDREPKEWVDGPTRMFAK